LDAQAANLFADALPLAEPLIEKWEGFRAAPYLCPAGIPTIGYGTTVYPNGVRVTLADGLVTIALAQAYLSAAVGRVAHDLFPLLKREPTVPQLAALLSLAYNIGVGVHDGIRGDLADSTLLARFNAGNIPDAADCFLDWDKAHIHGHLVVLPGLHLRRAEERALFLRAA
jgi:lysozyme